jgi:tRNA(His) 5'-end guanylyltransferase
MKFDDLDKKMRIYETAQDRVVPPEFFLVARIDGRSFTRLTKEVHNFESPFDVRFRDYMVETTKHLMNCGFRIIYGYTESDEISLLFHIDEDSFGRKTRKYNSILAGEASAKFSLLLNDIGTFDCRISEFPNEGLVIDYFRWRNEDANRNALNAHCYWFFRKHGQSQKDATNFLVKKTVAFKNEFLFTNGVNFNDLPNWQKRGIGLYWQESVKSGFNEKKQENVEYNRREIKIDMELPMKDEYSDFISRLIEENTI